MITPKEKAEELLNKYEKLLYPNKFATDDEWVNCIECALISVDECLHTCVESMIYYWKEVKQEIEKL